jgi:hypothetical protein
MVFLEVYQLEKRILALPCGKGLDKNKSFL